MTTEPTREGTELPPTEAAVQLPPSFLARYGLTPINFALLSLGVIFILYQVIGGVIMLLLLGTRAQFENIQGLRLFTMVAQLFLILVPTLILARLQTDNVKMSLRLKLTGWGQILLAIVGVLSLQQLLQLYMLAQDQIPIPPSVRPLVEQLRKMIEETYRNLVTARSIPELVYVLLVAALVPAFCEELLFRGLVQRNFEAGLRRSWAIIITGIIFGAYHLNPFYFIPLSLLGIYFGFLVFRSGSILTSVVAHLANNFFAIVAVFLKAEENFSLTEAARGLPASTIMLAVVGFGALFVLSTYGFIRITRPVTEELSG